MALSVSTLSNNAAVSKTWTEIGRDRESSEFINSTDSTSALDVRLTVKQSVVGKTSTGVPIRRSLVQATAVAPTSVVVNGNTRTSSEQITINVTVTSPTALATLTAETRKDLMAYLRGLISGNVIDQLARGEV